MDGLDANTQAIQKLEHSVELRGAEGRIAPWEEISEGDLQELLNKEIRMAGILLRRSKMGEGGFGAWGAFEQSVSK